MFGAVFHVHDKVDDIYAFSMCATVGAEAVTSVCVGVDLETWGFVVVKRTVETGVFVGSETVVG